MGEINESLSEAGKLLSQTLVLLLKVLFNTTRTTLVAKRPGGRVFTGSHPSNLLNHAGIEPRESRFNRLAHRVWRQRAPWHTSAASR